MRGIDQMFTHITFLLFQETQLFLSRIRTFLLNSGTDAGRKSKVLLTKTYSLVIEEEVYNTICSKVVYTMGAIGWTESKENTKPTLFFLKKNFIRTLGLKTSEN